MTEKTEPTTSAPAPIPTPKPISTTTPVQTEPSWKKIRQSLWRRLHRLAPNAVPWPYEEDAAYRKQRIQNSNLATRVPATEQIRTVALWGMELFGPSEIDRLYLALERLAWQQPFDTKVADWVRTQRSYGQGGSWINIGQVVRPGVKNAFFNRANFAQLPDEIEHAWVQIQQMSASLTCVQVCFVLRDDARRAYERELNTDRAQRLKRIRKSSAISIEGPEHLKRDAVNQARQRYKHLVAGWFSENMPGFFATSKRVSRFPTAELLTTKESFLLGEREPSASAYISFFTWNRLIANEGAHDVWTCASLPALQLLLANRSQEDIIHFTAAVHVPSIAEQHWEHLGPKDVGGVIEICRRELEGLFRQLGVTEYLKEAESDLKLARESMNYSNLKHQGAMSAIQRIQRFFDSSVGLPVVARELMAQAEGGHILRHSCSSFTAPEFHHGSTATRDLITELGFGAKTLSGRLREREAETREHFEQLSTVISMRESVKAQRRMEWLTLLALLVAAASLAIAIPEGWISVVQAIFMKLLSLLA